jgi:hypothetical protein
MRVAKIDFTVVTYIGGIERASRTDQNASLNTITLLVQQANFLLPPPDREEPGAKEPRSQEMREVSSKIFLEKKKTGGFCLFLRTTLKTVVSAFLCVGAVFF